MNRRRPKYDWYKIGVWTAILIFCFAFWYGILKLAGIL